MFKADTDLNAKITETRDAFEVPEREEMDPPTPEQVEENRAKWGYSV